MLLSARKSYSNVKSLSGTQQTSVRPLSACHHTTDDVSMSCRLLGICFLERFRLSKIAPALYWSVPPQISCSRLYKERLRGKLCSGEFLIALHKMATLVRTCALLCALFCTLASAELTEECLGCMCVVSRSSMAENVKIY